MGLKTNFAEVSVSVVDCPDLTQPPWHLAAPGTSLITLIAKDIIKFLRCFVQVIVPLLCH